MSDQQAQSTPAARQPRMVRLKVAGWLVLVLVAAALVAWSVKSWMCDRAVRLQAQELAGSLATAIAAFGNEDIIGRDYRQLQRYSDDLVRRKPVAYVAIADSRGRVVVHTNREFLGRDIEDAAEDGGLVRGSARVMDVTKQVGTVMVGVRPR